MSDRQESFAYPPYTSYVDIDHWALTDWLTRIMPRHHPELASKLQKARSLLDLGSGSGNAIAAVLPVLPNLSTVDTVEIGGDFRQLSRENIDNLKKRGVKIIKPHLNTLIAKFLKDACIRGEKFDVVTMGGVLSHRLEEGDGYLNLANVVNTGGVVMEFNDRTPFDQLDMELYFSEIQTIHSEDDTLRVWLRK